MFYFNGGVIFVVAVCIYIYLNIFSYTELSAENYIYASMLLCTKTFTFSAHIVALAIIREPSKRETSVLYTWYLQCHVQKIHVSTNHSFFFFNFLEIKKNETKYIFYKTCT